MVQVIIVKEFIYYFQDIFAEDRDGKKHALSLPLEKMLKGKEISTYVKVQILIFSAIQFYKIWVRNFGLLI